MLPKRHSPVFKPHFIIANCIIIFINLHINCKFTVFINEKKIYYVSNFNKLLFFQFLRDVYFTLYYCENKIST